MACLLSRALGVSYEADVDNPEPSKKNSVRVSGSGCRAYLGGIGVTQI